MVGMRISTVERTGLQVLEVEGVADLLARVGIWKTWYALSVASVGITRTIVLERMYQVIGGAWIDLTRDMGMTRHTTLSCKFHKRSALSFQ